MLLKILWFGSKINQLHLFTSELDMISGFLLIICAPVLFVTHVGSHGPHLVVSVLLLSLTFLWAAFSRLHSCAVLHGSVQEG